MGELRPATHAFASRAELAAALAGTVADHLRTAIGVRGTATLAVSGGTTPGAFFDALSSADLDWAKVVVTLVDERFVPPASDRSNAKLVRERLLKGTARDARFIPLSRLEPQEVPPPLTPPLKGEGGVGAGVSPSPLRGGVRGGRDADAEGLNSVESAADAAEPTLALLPLPLDVVVLGMGGDGHTASFFPDAPNLDALLDPAQPRLVLAVHAPSAVEPRLTLTLPTLASARYLALHIEGSEKRAVLEKALSGPEPTLPIRRVLDAAAPTPHIYWAP